MRALLSCLGEEVPTGLLDKTMREAGTNADKPLPPLCDDDWMMNSWIEVDPVNLDDVIAPARQIKPGTLDDSPDREDEHGRSPATADGYGTTDRKNHHAVTRNEGLRRTSDGDSGEAHAVGYYAGASLG
jgi:hypothetical protein